MELPMFEEKNAFEMWLHERAASLAMDVELVRISDTEPDWRVKSKESGAIWEILRDDGLFFKVKALRVLRAAGREVAKWAQPVFTDETDGRLATVIWPQRELFLVRAKAEPGNKGILLNGRDTCVLVSLPFQFSQGNYARHVRSRDPNSDVRPIPMMGFLDKHAGDWRPGPEDGGRFWKKVNSYAVIRVTAGESHADLSSALDELDEEQQKDFAWVSYGVLRHVRDSGLANQFLRAGMAYLF